MVLRDGTQERILKGGIRRCVDWYGNVRYYVDGKGWSYGTSSLKNARKQAPRRSK